MSQLCVNLPAKDKVAQPAYQSILNAQIPIADLPRGAGTVHEIAGDFNGHRGVAKTFTPIDLYDVMLLAESENVRTTTGATSGTTTGATSGTTTGRPIRCAHATETGHKTKPIHGNGNIERICNGKSIVTAMIGLAGWQHGRFLSTLENEALPQRYVVRLSLTLTTLMVACGIALALYLANASKSTEANDGPELPIRRDFES